MNIATIEVSGIYASAKAYTHIPAGLVGATITFEFTDPKWDGLSRTAVFKGNVTRDVIMSGDVVRLPPETVETPGGRLLIGVYGVDGDENIVIPTLWADIGPIRPAADPSGDPGTDPDLPIWAQLQDRVEALESGYPSDPDSPVTPGKPGADGFSPIAKVEQTTTGAVISITDKTGTTTAIVTNGKDGKDGAEGQSGEDGGYYIPAVTQPSSDTVEFAFSPSKPDMPAVDPVQVKLPVGQGSGGNVDLTGVVRSVNGQTPDENGNVEIAVSEVVATIEPTKKDIPRVFFGSPLQPTKTELVTTFSYRSETLSFDCYAEIKAQGNSTLKWPKKNQTVKLYKDAECTEKLKIDFKGWGKQNKFVIKANWRDLTHVRDIISVRLEGDCLRTNPEYDDFPELLKTSPNVGGVDGFPVLVYAAGIYQGRYMWNIPKDKWMANMDDELDEHCILCGEGYESGCFREASVSQWTDEIHDSMPSVIRTRWLEVISFVMNSTDEEFVTNLDSYIKVSTLIDRHIMGLLSCDFDGYGKNQLYITYDGQQWYANRYDKDGTWGNFWTGDAMLPSDYGREEYEDMSSGSGGNLLFIRLERLFWERLQTRWEELKTGVLSIPNIINRFRELYDITPPYVIEEDYANSTANGAFINIPNKTTCTIQQIQRFVVERHAWVDDYIAKLSPDFRVPCTGISLDKTELTFNNESTQTITATVTPNDTTDRTIWVSSDPDVASVVVNGNVCMVLSVGNGNTTITATCGEYSAVCTVAVSGFTKESYRELAYIESDGNQYIDTGVSGGETSAYTIKFNALTSQARNWEKYFCGVKPAESPTTSINYQTGKLAVSPVNSGSSYYISETLDGVDRTVQIAQDGTLYVDDNPVNGYTAKANGWGEMTWYLFSSHAEPNLMSSLRVYYLKMWKDGVLVRDYIPAMRDSDGAVGLLDKVTNVFFENQGTGTFISGGAAIPCTDISLDNNSLTFNGVGTQTIIATVAPSDTTDDVVWVSSDPDVASISVDGNVCTVQSVGNGDATITVTCGEHSASCAVSVSGIETGVLYELPEATTFNGVDDYIDTGVVLSAGSTFAVFVKWDAQTPTKEVSYPMSNGALDISYSSTKQKYAVGMGGNAFFNFNPGNTVWVYYLVENGKMTTSAFKIGSGAMNTVSQNIDYNGSARTVLLGARWSDDNSPEYLWDGTMHDFRIYNRALTPDELSALMT